MAFGSSPAETLFSTWHTKPVAKKVSEEGIKAGHFETFLKGNGFKPLIDGLQKLHTATIINIDALLRRHSHSREPRRGRASA